MLSRNSFLKFVSHYPARHLTTDHHQALVAERSKALQLSWRGLAGCGFESRWRHIIYFHFEFFAPSPFRTGQRSRCKWNQACPFTWSHSCFRPQIWFIIQGLVYKYLQYSFNQTMTVLNWSFYWITRSFHRAFATGIACKKGTLIPMDTWSHPFWTCSCSTCWDQYFS